MTSPILATTAQPRKAALARSTAQPQLAHAAQLPEQPESGTRLVVAECTESLAKDFSHLNGYLVLDRAGEFVAWAADSRAAKLRLDAGDENDARGWTVERCSDGALIARMPARKPRDVP